MVVFTQILKLTQQLFLTARQIDRSFHRQFDEHIANTTTTQRRHAFAAQAHLAT